MMKQSFAKKVEKMVKESLMGLSFDNFIRNGHFHINSRSKNPVIRTAWKYGWELNKEDANNIEGEYQAKIMSGVFNDIKPDTDINTAEHPKASWPMLIAMLNKDMRPMGYVVSGTDYRVSRETISGEESSEGKEMVYGTIIVRKN